MLTSSLKKGIIGALCGIAILVIGYFYFEDHYFPSTDDAYVHGHIIHVAPQVSGQVIQVYVSNLNEVKAGAKLFQIDPKPYQLAVNKAQANLQLTQTAYQTAQTSYDLAKKIVSKAQEQLDIAQKSYQRMLKLRKQSVASKQQLDDSKNQYEQAQSSLLSAQDKVATAKANLGNYQGQSTKLQMARIELEQAKLDLKHTVIYASENGYLANFELQPGTWVSAGMPQFLILTRDQWILANFKETQLTRIKPGQAVTIDLPTAGSGTLHGVVESISRSSGAFTSLLPPENASGNWVKVVGRFPVKIVFKDLSPNDRILDGASAEVTVNTWHTTD